jgi:hypothetical protein
MKHIDFNDDDFNSERLAEAVDSLEDRNSRGLGHVYSAKSTLRRMSAVVTDARLDTGVLTGRVLDDHLAQLLELEGDLSRTEGELAG